MGRVVGRVVGERAARGRRTSGRTGARSAAALAALLALSACAGGPGGSGGDVAPREQAEQRVAAGEPPLVEPPRSASPVDSGASGGRGDPDAPDPQDLEDLAALAEGEARAQERSVPAFDGPVLGGDISWPQCPRGLGIPEKRTLGLPPPLPEARYVVIGLTNGPGFVANPCLADQVAESRERDLLVSAYAVSSFPSAAEQETHGADGPYPAGSRLGRLANTGYQQARYNVASMRAAGLETPVVWIDVEPVPDFAWSSDPTANAAVVQGVARGYTDAGYRIGVYSTPLLWEQVVGPLELGLPEWRAAGQTSRAEAASRCGDDWVIQGGEAVMGQWVEASRDQNVTCGDVHLDLGRWFHRY
ncbi:glycoside hydrolase family 25 domain-containing protein [Nocardioides kribbensis]|uniref:hypothetical protein n=1 Tax=Nocardioides kribbensis TaxID=305517 RepID=UPI001879A659|nr:hypothetical protein [Nocardioides kribbensis]